MAVKIYFPFYLRYNVKSLRRLNIQNKYNFYALLLYMFYFVIYFMLVFNEELKFVGVK